MRYGEGRWRDTRADPLAARRDRLRGYPTTEATMRRAEKLKLPAKTKPEKRQEPEGMALYDIDVFDAIFGAPREEREKPLETSPLETR